jgi:hypothetical protein
MRRAAPEIFFLQNSDRNCKNIAQNLSRNNHAMVAVAAILLLVGCKSMQKANMDQNLV